MKVTSLYKSRFSLIALFAIFVLIFHNRSFWPRLWEYGAESLQFSALTALLLFAGLMALLTSFANRYTLKPVMMLLLIIGAASSYFVDAFGVVIDRPMLINALSTTPREAGELMTWKWALHLFLLGAVPVGLVVFMPVEHPKFIKALFVNAAVITACITVAVVIAFANYAKYASVTRNHLDLLAVLNPVQPVRSAVELVMGDLLTSKGPVVAVGRDAVTEESLPGEKPRLTVLILGETARAQSFSLNGYERETNPELKQHNIINYSNVSACGTATAQSVPCLFSNSTRKQFNRSRAERTENVLDVLQHAGYEVVWWDNNTGSKHVADRISFESVTHDLDPNYCSTDGCFDGILIEKLRNHIAKMPSKNTVLVIHQLGSHGPAYYKRTPQKFKKFLPECVTSELSECSRQEIVNAYDNTILYTDHIVASAISLLKENSDRYDTGLMYISDHGESTGEGGTYLHGLPYFMAPKSQTHVPMIMWFSEGLAKRDDVDVECLKKKSAFPISHDHFFDTLLELQEVDSEELPSKLDLIDGCDLGELAEN